MPPTTQKQNKKILPECWNHRPLQQYDLPTSDTTETIIKIATWNQNTPGYSPTITIQLAIQNEIDILTIQEQNKKITDPHTHEHTDFNSHVITLPSVIFIDSRVIFNFIFTHFFPTLHTEHKAIWHHHSSISLRPTHPLTQPSPQLLLDPSPQLCKCQINPFQINTTCCPLCRLQIPNNHYWYQLLGHWCIQIEPASLITPRRSLQSHPTCMDEQDTHFQSHIKILCPCPITSTNWYSTSEKGRYPIT